MLNVLLTFFACFGEYKPNHSNGIIQDGNIEESSAGLTLERDSDGDGFSQADGDCDDDDPSSYPGAEEICDELDNNCNGLIDEGHDKWWYLDLDADGYGDQEQLR